MDLTNLMRNMVRIIIENTGAERGFFIVPDKDEVLWIQAYGESGVDQIQFESIMNKA